MSGFVPSRDAPRCAILSLMPNVSSLSNVLLTTFDLLLDALRFMGVSLRPRCALAAENLFLRKQLALYLERKVNPHRAKAPTKLTLVLLSRLFAWREALTVVKPATLIRWHRKGFRLFWRWKSRPRGRPRIPAELQKLIIVMADENPTWGEERIAAEQLLKLGIRISPRTARGLYPPDQGPQRGRALDDICPQPCPRPTGLRLLRRREGQFSAAIRLRDRSRRWERSGSLTLTSQLIPRRIGRSSSSGRSSQERNRTGSSSTTAITFTPPSSTRP